MSGKNLWGKIPNVDKIRTPYEILHEQSVFLIEATGGLLDVVVARSQQSGIFSYSFSVIAPSVNFRKMILQLRHDIKLYPCQLLHDLSDEEYNAKDQAEFENDLEAILTSAETRTIISGMLAQAKFDAEQKAIKQNPQETEHKKAS